MERTSIRQDTGQAHSLWSLSKSLLCSSWPQFPFCAPRSALPWLEASSWPPPICPLALLGLTLSFQPLHFAVLAKVVVTHKHMCGQVGGREEG